MSKEEDADLLQELLGETSADTFFGEYWQKKPLHVDRQNPSFYADVFDPTGGDMEEMWANAAPLQDGTVMFFQGVGEPIKLPSPFFAFPHRCSVVVNKGDRCSSALHRLCIELQKRFPFVYTNVYLTPSNAQSVPRHSDDREVLMLQVFGSKRWTVYDDPVRLPYKDEEVGKRAAQEAGALSKVLERTMRQGDLMYLPRGFVHEGAAGAEPSMHITVALQSSDWDYRSAALSMMAQAMRSIPEARDCLPPDVLAGGGSGGADASAKFDLVLEKSVAALKGEFGAAAAEFRDRLGELREERDAAAAKLVSHPPFGITAQTQLIWNPVVELVDVTKALEAKVQSVEHLAHFTRRSRDSPAPMRMSLAVSDAVLRNIMLLQEKHKDVPIEVGSLLMGDALSRISLAYFLLNNESCILVK